VLYIYRSGYRYRYVPEWARGAAELGQLADVVVNVFTRRDDVIQQLLNATPHVPVQQNTRIHNVYTVSQKNIQHDIVHIFTTYEPIFKILSLTHSPENQQQNGL